MGRLRDVRMVGEGLVLEWLRACLSNEAGQMVRASGRARDRAMRTSLALIEQADLSQLTPAALCETCGVGERTLQYAFRERFGLTPAAFLKARRLALVRSALQQFEAKQAGIGDLAARYGFWHPGQFASDYRRAFSETPSETLRRAIQRV
jgi:AraC family ethanolamine operon transcriptional activator